MQSNGGIRFAHQAVIKGLQRLGLWAFFFILCMAPSTRPRFPAGASFDS